MRTFAAGIVIKDNAVLVMHRINKGRNYFTFPGGSHGEEELLEETAIREVMEETSIRVSVDRLLYKIIWDTGNENYYFLCKYIEGTPILPESSEEFTQTQNGLQIYDPRWLSINALQDTLLYPLEIRDLFINHIKTNYPLEPLTLSLEFGTKRFF